MTINDNETLETDIIKAIRSGSLGSRFKSQGYIHTEKDTGNAFMNKHTDPRMHSAEHILNQTMIQLYGCGRCFAAHITVVFLPKSYIEKSAQA